MDDEDILVSLSRLIGGLIRATLSLPVDVLPKRGNDEVRIFRFTFYIDTRWSRSSSIESTHLRIGSRCLARWTGSSDFLRCSRWHILEGEKAMLHLSLSGGCQRTEELVP